MAIKMRIMYSDDDDGGVNVNGENCDDYDV